MGEEVVWMVNVECRCLALLDYARGIRILGRQVNSFAAGGRLPTAVVSGQARIDDNGLGPSVLLFELFRRQLDGRINMPPVAFWNKQHAFMGHLGLTLPQSTNAIAMFIGKVRDKQTILHQGDTTIALPLPLAP
jgi:hypothetical protein